MLNITFVYKWMFILVLPFLISCNSNTPNENEPSTPKPVSTTSVDIIDNVDTSPYPSQTVISMTEAYPIVDTVDENRILLAFDKPIVLGSTEATGVGPPGLSIYILNITFMGEELGSGSIDNDGTFTIPLSEFSSGIRLGLAVDINSIGLTEDDIQPSENAISVPQVGYFYDSYVIQE